MKICIVLCLFAFVAVAVSLPGEKYTDKYDNVDVIDEVMTNPRLLDSAHKCIMGIGKCTEAMRELASHIKEALETECAKCTVVQKEQTRRMMSFLINEKPVYWSQLTAKYDPDNKYVTKYEKELKEIKA